MADTAFTLWLRNFFAANPALSQREFARMLEIDDTVVGRWLKGYSQPSYEALAALKRFKPDLDLNQLFPND